MIKNKIILLLVWQLINKLLIIHKGKIYLKFMFEIKFLNLYILKIYKRIKKSN